MKLALAFLAFSLALFGATATPVTISTISRSGSTVTVTTAAAHLLAVNQGVQISGVTDATNFPAFNGTIATVPDATHYTLVWTGAAASSSGGQSLAAKKLIVLRVNTTTSGIQVNALCWVTTQQGVVSSVGSGWPGASAAEVAAINAGTTQEVALSPGYGSGTTKAAIQTDLQNQCNQLQANLTNASVQPGQFFGQFCDAVGCSF